MKKIDAFGKACPLPVIMVKKEIEGMGDSKEDIFISVDNFVAVENLKKLSNFYGVNFEYTEKVGGYDVIIKSSEYKKLDNMENIDLNQFVEDTVSYLITNDKIGKGDDELGTNLMQMSLYALTQIEVVPKTIAMMNSGVFLATKNEETVKSLRELEEKGTRILVCGACLNFYGLVDELKVGDVSNAYEIMSNMQNGTVVNL